MRTGSLFTGYGGLDAAANEVFGATTAWVSDIDKGACKILAHRFPDLPNLGDIASIDWSTVEPVDIITGGFPCQDVSHAGKRAGLKSGTRSGLWSHMAHAISELRPRMVVAENVRGLLSAESHSDVEPCAFCLGDGSGVHMRALGTVLADLAELGFDAQWYGLRAADIGAPHGRFRVFVIATERVAAAGSGERDRATDWGALGDGRVTPNAQREEQREPTVGGLRDESRGGARVDWGDYTAAIERWESVLGRRAPAPTEPGRNGKPRLSPRFVEWLMGLPEGRVCDVPGLTRNEALKALGNGVVSQQAYAAITHMLNTNQEMTA